MLTSSLRPVVWPGTPSFRRGLLAGCAVAAVLSAQAQSRPATQIDEAVATGIVSDAATSVVDPQLIMLKRQTGRNAAQTTGASANGIKFGGPPLVGGLVRIEAMSKRDDAALLRELEAAGATGLKTQGNLVVGKIAPSNIDALQAVTAARFVRPTQGPVANTGTVNSQGDAAQKSDVARRTDNVDGTGVTVGVISTSYNRLNGAAKDVASGNLPGAGNGYGHTTPVKVLKESTVNTDDEGRAMLQIVHDVAPGAKLSFYGPDDIFDHAAGLRALAAAGARVISDDLYWYSDPWFQEGPISIAQRDILKNNGTTTFTIAGNWATESAEGVFKPLGVHHINENGASIGRWSLHDWGNGAATIPVVLHRGSNITVVLQWDEPYASSSTTRQGSGSDLDLFAFNDAQGVNLRFSSAARNVNGDPIEILNAYLNANDASDTFTFYLGIGQPYKVGAQPGKFKIVVFESPDVPAELPRATLFNKSTAVGHSASEWAVVSCAVRYSQVNTARGPQPEAFSSAGGFARTRDASGARLPSPLDTKKPDLCGPDGVNTTFFGGGDPEGDGLPNFYGTSAASPHLAGVAALMLQASNLRLPADQIGAVMKATAIDMDDPYGSPSVFDKGYDVKTGAGFVQADKAVSAAKAYR